MDARSNTLGTLSPALAGSPATTADMPPAVPVMPPMGSGEMARWITIIQRVWSCGRQLRRWLDEQLAPWQLTDSQFLLMFSCRQTGPEGLAQHELSGALGMSAAKISGIVEQLAERGLVELQRSARDRRRQIVRLTTHGARQVETILGHLAPLAARLEPATEEQQEVARQWLQRCERSAA